MIIERVEVTIKDGYEEDYLQAISEMRGLLASAEGCSSVSFGRGVENPSKALLLLSWDTLESHTNFRRTSEHAQLVAKAGGFVASASVEHFACR